MIERLGDTYFIRPPDLSQNSYPFADGEPVVRIEVPVSPTSTARIPKSWIINTEEIEGIL